MKTLRYSNAAVRLFQGADCLRMLSRELDRVNSRRAVLFCGQSVGAHESLCALVRQSIGDRLVGVFDQVRTHSPISTVEAGARALAELNADSVIAVGGGSAIVSARAASILLAERQEIMELCTHRTSEGRLVSPRLDACKLPQFVIPTTPTTAAVKAGSAVLDPVSGRRLAMYDPKTRAQAVFIHPAFVLSAPLQLALTASLQTLAMAIEGLGSNARHALSDADLLHSVTLLRRSLPLLNREGTDHEEIRGNLMLSAVLCGRGTDQAGGGLCSALTHAIGARFDVANGLLSAILLPHTLSFNAAAIRPDCSTISGAGVGDGQALDSEYFTDCVPKLLSALSVPTRLRDVGIPQSAIPSIALAAFDDWFLESNPRLIPNTRTLECVLEAAW